MKALECITETVAIDYENVEEYTTTYLVTSDHGPLTDDELDQVVDFVFDTLYPEDTRTFLGEVLITREEYLEGVKASPLAEKGVYEIAHSIYPANTPDVNFSRMAA